MTGPSSTALARLDGDGPDPEAKAQDRAARTLAGLMEEIAACRAEILRREALADELERRLRREFSPLEAQLVSARLDTFRILGRHLRDGWLGRRALRILREALAGLADELEGEYGVDLRADRRIYLGEDPEEESEVAVYYRGRKPGSARKAAPAEDPECPGEGGEDGTGPLGEEPSDGRDPGDADRRSGGARGSRQRPDSKAARRRAEKESALAGDLRALYLILARALHPDKEANPALREAKTVWMQKVTQAYAKKDLAMLLDILARNPLEAVGPYLSQAPLKTVQGFVKRLRRELAALKAQAAKAGEWQHPFFARFIRADGIDEAGVARHLGEMRRTVRLMKQRRDVYRTREGVLELVEGLQLHNWRDLM